MFRNNLILTIAFFISGQAYPPVVFDWSQVTFWARDLKYTQHKTVTTTSK
jgi:hypothetical protein